MPERRGVCGTAIAIVGLGHDDRDVLQLAWPDIIFTHYGSH